MGWYTVTIRVKGTCTFQIETHSAEDAKACAFDLFENGADGITDLEATGGADVQEEK